MSINKERYFDRNGEVKPEAIVTNTWLKYIISVESPYWNAERIEKMEDKQKNSVLEYVIRTLDILDSISGIDDRDYNIIRTVLCWSEVAKAGTFEDRKRWIERNYPLDIHNEASAMIYADHYVIRNFKIDPIYLFIKTHGLAGQYIRGEASLNNLKELSILATIEDMNITRFTNIFENLNRCIIEAVDLKIWENIKFEIHEIAMAVYLSFDRCILPKLDAESRLKALLPNNGIPLKNDILFFKREIFSKYDLWYFQSALEPFGFSNATQICKRVVEVLQNDNDIKHLNFKLLADEIYYNYEGKKHINVYKQRIIERYIENPKEYGQHVKFIFEKKRISLLIGIEFTPVCKKLIDFCIEAERSGLFTYEKSITLLYDTFSFRRDKFDRLNNEMKYLNTMNTVKNSTKLTILDYIVGNKILDVGSGGGILLDQIEKRYPKKEIIGTDISQNVIELLNKKKRDENHNWTPIKHNFVDSVFSTKVDTIIFSSIIHEIYSYSDIGNGKFDKKTIKQALSNAVKSLKDGGRIIIRDGIVTASNERMRINFKTEEGFVCFQEFLNDFKGMDFLPYNMKCSELNYNKLSVITDINYGREFLYTYTWGKESYPHEVQECFGYYTLDDFYDVFEELGMQVIVAKSFLEEGYKTHLDSLVEIFNETIGNNVPMQFPDSNCIIVAEKQK